ncbi:inositol-tetrakisphosphate 1-kinase [Aplochiton taeniatus]
MQTLLKGIRVGYWLTEKKMKKLNFGVFVDMCRKKGIELVALDLSHPLEEQGPLDVIIHKLNDLLLEADQNNTQALRLMQTFQEYIEAHPEMIVLDPLPAIRTLLDRFKSYQLIQRMNECMAVCKTRVAHGTDSHKMAIIFSEAGLEDIKPPCVVQSFINHNAVLYKVFVVGEAYTVVERPSIRNFPSGPAERKSIFFNSHDVSKPECTSDLTSRDHVEGVPRTPCDDIIRELCLSLRRSLGVSLFGVDIIISSQTGQHAVIDVNSFPGYEGVTQFYDDLLSHLTRALKERASGNSAGEHTPAVATATCGKPCVPVGKEDNTWLVEASDDGIKPPGTRQGLGCNSEVPANFQQQCMSEITP